MKSTRIIVALSLACVLYISSSARRAHAQAAAEPGIPAKIAELEQAKKGLARQARESNGYHESLRQMKIVKIDDLIARLKRGENVPQSKIEKTIGHMSFPLDNPPQ